MKRITILMLLLFTVSAMAASPPPKFKYTGSNLINKTADSIGFVFDSDTLWLSNNSINWPRGLAHDSTLGMEWNAINVRSYGAVGNGTTDDRDSIQAALDAAQGGAVYIPEGVFLIESTLYIPDSTMLFGEGFGSIIQMDSLVKKVMLENSDSAAGQSGIVIRGIHFDGDRVYSDYDQPDSADVIVLKNVSKCAIVDCFVEGSDKDGIAIRGGSEVTIANNTVWNTGEDCITISGVGSSRNIIMDNKLTGHDSTYEGTGGRAGLNPSGILCKSSEAIISGNTIKYCGAAVDINSESGDSLFNTVIVGNQFIEVGQIGISLLDASYITVTGNVFVDCPALGIRTDQSALTSHNITISDNSFSGQGGKCIDLASGDNHIVVGNMISDCGATAIYVTGDHITVSDNQIDSAGGHGIHLASSRYSSVNSNVLRFATNHGIYSEGANTGYEYMAIANNTIRKCVQDGIYMLSSDYSSIAGNTCVDNDSATSGSYNGIHLNNSDHCDVSGNVCHSPASMQTYGIKLESNCNRTNVRGNQLAGNVTGGLTGGTNSVEWGNWEDSTATAGLVIVPGAYRGVYDADSAYVTKDYADGLSGGTDDQTIETFSLSTNTISLGLEDDGEADKTIDISTSTAVTANTAKVTDDDDGVNEPYAVGWNGDVEAPEKDDVYDYLIQIDPDADGQVQFDEVDGAATDGQIPNGITITGLDPDSGNWNDAYDWGDHSTEGYLTTETDDQTIETFDLTGNTVSLGLEDDGEADKTIDLSLATDIAANTAKTTNQTHTGDVTGSVGLMIANDAVDTAHLNDTELKEYVNDVDSIAIANGTQTRITVTPQADNTVDFVVDDIDALHDNLTEFVDQTAWRMFYSNASGDVTEVGLGSATQVLTSNGASAAPSFQAPGAGTGTPDTFRVISTADGDSIDNVGERVLFRAGVDSGLNIILVQDSATMSINPAWLDAVIDSSDLVHLADYQPLEATLTDIADGTIAENLVNTDNPWAVNEVHSDLLTSTEGDAAYQPLEATLTDIADGTIAENLVNTDHPWAVNEVHSDLLTSTEGDAAYQPLEATLIPLVSAKRSLPQCYHK